MTEAPVPPLAAQIEKVQRQIRYAQEDHAPKAERLWSSVLASLQQHERAMAVVEAARGYIDSCNSLGRRDTVKLIELNRALAALDDAAGKGET